MIIIKNSYKNKGVIIHLRRPGGSGMMRIELDSADKAQLKALKDAGHDAVEESKNPVK